MRATLSQDPSRVPSWEWPAAVTGAALAGLAVWLAGSRWGAAVSPDSTVYLSAAENLVKGRGLVTFDGQPLVSWAPLYPAVLAAFEKLGAAGVVAARWLGTLGMVAMVLGAAVWLRRHVASPGVRLVVVTAVACSTAVLRDALFVWSEILFLLCLVLCLMDLERFMVRSSRSTLLAAALWAALTSLIRYVGVTAGIAGVLVVLFAPGTRSARRRMLDALLFGVVALGPLALWLARNAAVSGTLVYPATPPPSRAAWQIAADGFQIMAQEWLPYAVPHGLRAVLVLVALALLVAGLARSRFRGVRSSPAPAVLWLLLYAAALLAGALRVAVEPVSQRFVSPMLVPLLVLAARAADDLLADRPRVMRLAALTLALCWLAYSVSRARWHLVTYYRTGAESYTAPAWRHSELAAALRRSALAGPASPDTVYGNAPDVVYFLAGLPAQFSPRRTYYASDRPVTEDLPRFAHAVARRPVRLAWFHELARDFLYSPAQLGERFEVTPEGRFADGEIDWVTLHHLERGPSDHDTVEVMKEILLPGTPLMSETLFGGPQPKHSPKVRVEGSVDGAGYDAPPEVVEGAVADMELPSTHYDPRQQKLFPEYLYDTSGRVRGAYVRAVIETTGAVHDIRPLVSEPKIAAAMTAAATRWRFTPAKRRGKDVAVWAVLGIYAK